MVRIDLGGKNLFGIGDIIVDKEGESTTIRRKQTTGKKLHFEWSTVQPRLVVTSDTEEFDERILGHFQEEGFQCWYIPYVGNRKAYTDQIRGLGDSLGLGETFAIVSYGDAAALCLEAAMRPITKLQALVAYYPPYMPKTANNYPITLDVLIHLAGSQKVHTRHQRNFRYPKTEPGFAESDMEEYSRAEAGVAWSRTLGTLRKAFGVEEDLEAICDHYKRLKLDEKDADATLELMGPRATVNYAPTMTGGSGQKDLKRFYEEFFMQGNPDDLRLRLLSRIVGVDKVVDEMLVTFTHDCEVHWILPGVPPTGKKVEIVIVAIVGIRGGKVYQENIHWDQASVLVQVGLLDPKYVPKSFKGTGKEKKVERLPVFGAEATKKVVNDERNKNNELISNW